jgi:hypothetical protein
MEKAVAEPNGGRFERIIEWKGDMDLPLATMVGR